MNRRERRAQEKAQKKTAGSRSSHELKRAVTLHVNGKRAEAEDIYLGLLRRDHVDADVNYYYGVLCFETGRIELAIRCLQVAERARPGTADVLAYLGMALHRAKDISGAIIQLEGSLSIMPGHKMALTALGGVFLEQSRAVEAASLFRRALAVDPGDPLTQGNLRMALRAAGKPAEALAARVRTPFSARTEH